MSDEPLSRMKIKLDQCSEAIMEIDRMEGRLLKIFKRMTDMDAAFKKYVDLVMRLKGKL